MKMNTHTSKYKIVLLSIIIILISGCNDNVIRSSENIQLLVPTITEEKPSLLVLENYEGLVQEAGQYVRFNKVSIENVIYYIDREEYTSEDCNNILYDIHGIIKLLIEKYEFTFPEDLSVYIGNKIITQGIKGAVYLNSSDLKSLDGLIAIMAGLNGELVNYGICYGFGIHIINEEGLSAEYGMERFDAPWLAVHEQKLSDYFSIEENLILLDLMLPVFETEYFSEDDNLHASSISYLLTQYIINQYGAGLLTSMISESSELTLDFDILYTETCNEWLSSIGASCRRTTPEAFVRCIRNYERASAYRYIFHTKNMRSYITKDHFDISSGIVLTYPEIIRMLALGEADLLVVKEYMSPYFNTDLIQIPCYYYKKEINLFKGKYIEYTTPYYAFVHEYVHYITSEYDSKKDKWLMDGIAIFIQYYVPGNLLSHVISYENMERQIKSNLKNDEENDEEIYIELENIYSAYNIVLNDKGAYGGGIFCDIISCLRYNTDEEKANTLYEAYGSGTKAGYISYEEVGSMVNYLINEYGADTFYSLYKNIITLEEAYGKDVDELYEEWGKHITEEYREILKIDTNN